MNAKEGEIKVVPVFALYSHLYNVILANIGFNTKNIISGSSNKEHSLLLSDAIV